MFINAFACASNIAVVILCSIMIICNCCNCVVPIFRNEALRVAFIDEVETLTAGKSNKEFFSKLVKGDINGKDKVISFTLYSI